MSDFSAGDVCYTASPFKGQRGAFVVLVRRAVPGDLGFSGTEGVIAWVCNGWVRWKLGTLFGPQVVISQRCLRKVDPGEQVDEVLREVGHPLSASHRMKEKA